MIVQCPHCGTLAMPHVEPIGPRDEPFDSTHECMNPKCALRFKRTPPTREISAEREVWP